jgi:hypothetical protein
MNEELIKKLHDQAWGETHEKAIAVTKTPIDFQKVLRERFAELIVKECIDKITTYDLVPGHSAKWEDIYDIHARLLQDLAEDLKEHFGVDE